MANIDDGFNVEVLSMDDITLVGTGTAEPNVGAGYNAPTGSVYLKNDPGTDGQMWVKFGPNDVDWKKVIIGNNTHVPQATFSIFGKIFGIAGNTVIPVTITAPLITDGTEIFTETMTPATINSEIKITISLAFTVSNAASQIVATLFRDNIPIGAMSDTVANSNNYQTVSFAIKDPGPFVPGVPVVYSCRFGKTGGNATWYVNTNAAGEDFGGHLTNNAYTIEEVIPL